MSRIADTATVTLVVNGKPAKEELEKIETSLAAAKKKLIELQNQGADSKSIRKVQNEISTLERRLEQTLSRTEGVKRALMGMDGMAPRELNRALRTLMGRLSNIQRGSKDWYAHVEAIKTLKARIAEFNADLRDTGGLWGRFKSWAEDTWPAIDLLSRGYDAAVCTLREYVDAYATMDQEMANVRKFTGMTAEQVAELNGEFKKMDTRTSREDLNKLAQEAGRLGKTSKEDVLGFVRAADKINVALDDLGEGATLTLSKLTGVFGDEARYGTEQSLLKVGSVINELSQNCSASAPYLANFASRMGGVGAQAKMTIPQIMAFGAVLDTNGQAVEASATALSQVIVRMMQEPAKYAKVAGLDVKKFSDMLKTDVNGALLLFLETLQQAGGMDVLSPMFKDMGENGSRAISALSTLATHIDMVKAQQIEANKAFREGVSIDKEFEVQNTTVQAALDKAKKAATEIRVELGEHLSPLMAHLLSSSSAVMRALSVFVRFVFENKSAILSLAAGIAAYTIAVKTASAAAAAEAAVIKVATATKAAAAVVTQNLKVAYLAMTGQTYAAAKAQLALNAAQRANPLGLLFGLLVTVAGAIMTYKNRVKEAARAEAEAARQKAEYAASLRQLDNRQEENANNELERVKKLMAAAKDESKSRNDRLEAVKKLQTIYPEYFGQLTTEQILVGDTTKAYNSLAASIIKAARYRAGADKIIENEGLKADKEKELSSKNDTVAALVAEREQLKKDLQMEIDRAVEGYQYDGDKKRVRDALESGKAGNAAIRAIRARLNETQTEINSLGDQITSLSEGIDEIDSVNKEIQSKYGISDNDIAASLQADNANVVTPSQPQNPDNDPNKSKERFAGEKAWREHEEASARIAYAKGEATYSQHMARMAEIEAEYYKKVLDRADVVGEEKHRIEASYQESSRKQKEANNKRSVAEEEKDYQDLLDRFRTNHQKRLSQEGLSAQDRQREQEYYAEVLELAELQHLQNILDIYEEGSDEWLEVQRNLQNKEIAAQERHLKKMERQQQEYANIKKKVFGMSQSEKDDEFKKQFDALTAVYNQELAAAGDNEAEKLRIKEAYMAAELALRKEYNQAGAEDTKSAYETAIGKSAEWLQGDGGKALTGAISTLTSGMSSIFSGLSSMIQAEIEVQTAKIEKRYDREIELAQGNSYKVAKLEKQKQKQIAKMKNEANKKMFAMQVIQAVAQTAQNALGAYGSTVVIPVVGKILAPIAAAAAIAAGMIQVAAIKKQQQAAEAQGYSKGGFTKPGAVDEPAGIVHAGEWVASQKLLASPIARPMIEALDYVQRTNTIGSLRPEDVSRSIRANDSLVRIAEDGSSGALVVAAVARNAQAVDALVARLNEPFVTVNTVTGDHGIKQAQDEYSRLMDNVTPKSKRKK